MMHGIGVEMAEALAEYWHRIAVRDRVGVRRPGRTEPRRWPVCSARNTEAAAIRAGYPGLPRPPGQRHDRRRLLEVRIESASRSSEETGWQYQPEQTTSAIICHHPQSKYFVAR